METFAGQGLLGSVENWHPLWKMLEQAQTDMRSSTVLNLVAAIHACVYQWQVVMETGDHNQNRLQAFL